MFSSGNITEKMRVAKFDCTGQTVVDLYAGIGYYTLQYLKHTNGLYDTCVCYFRVDDLTVIHAHPIQKKVFALLWAFCSE